MTDNFRRWGVELQGHAEELKIWQRAFTAPHDPFVEAMEIENSSGVILRSEGFMSLSTAIEVADLAESIIQRINGVFELERSSTRVVCGAVMEFDTDGTISARTVSLEAVSIGTFPIDVGSPSLTVFDHTGLLTGPLVVEQVISETAKQRLLKAAAACQEISRALDHVAEGTDWFQLYKAYEALEGLPCGSITRKQKECFKRTANVPHRHDPKNNQPPINPMSIKEGRGMIREWLRVACDHVLRDER